MDTKSLIGKKEVLGMLELANQFVGKLAQLQNDGDTGMTVVPANNVYNRLEAFIQEYKNQD